MTFVNASVSDLTSIIRDPSYAFPVFFLIFKKNSLIVQIFPYLDRNIFRLIDFTSNVEGLDSIRNVPDGILLGLSIFDWQLCFFIIFVGRKKMNAPFRKLVEDRRRGPISFFEVF